MVTIEPHCRGKQTMSVVITPTGAGAEAELVALFTASFTASEGAQEGALIGQLVQDLLTQTPAADLYVCREYEGEELVGACCFSRLSYQAAGASVFVLGPVAVAHRWQGRGIGQRMLTQALTQLRQAGVALVMTYGDPDFYGNIGFVWVREQRVAAPFALQYPHGWLGLCLNEQPFPALPAPCRCVAAFADPRFW